MFESKCKKAISEHVLGRSINQRFCFSAVSLTKHRSVPPLQYHIANLDMQLTIIFIVDYSTD